MRSMSVHIGELRLNWSGTVVGILDRRLARDGKREDPGLSELGFR